MSYFTRAAIIAPKQFNRWLIVPAALAIHLSIHVAEKVQAELLPHYGADCPAAIVWDWDNTLVDGWAAIAAGLNAAFAAFGLPAWSVEEVRARVRRSLRESFPEVFGLEWERARDVFYAEVRARHLGVLTAMPGAEDALRARRQK